MKFLQELGAQIKSPNQNPDRSNGDQGCMNSVIRSTALLLAQDKKNREKKRKIREAKLYISH